MLPTLANIIHNQDNFGWLKIWQNRNFSPSNLLKVEIFAVLIYCTVFWIVTNFLIFTILDSGHCIWELRDNNFSAYQITTPWIYVPLPKTCTILVRHVATLQNSLLSKHSIHRGVLWTSSSMSWTEREYNSTFKRETSPYPLHIHSWTNYKTVQEFVMWCLKCITQCCQLSLK